jgi:hypothetical protein
VTLSYCLKKKKKEKKGPTVVMGPLSRSHSIHFLARQNATVPNHPTHSIVEKDNVKVLVDRSYYIEEEKKERWMNKSGKS